MNRRLKLYVGLVGAAAIALLATHVPDRALLDWGHYVAWIVVCVISDTLWINTSLGATLSLSSTAGVAAVVLWGDAAGMWVGAISTLIGEFFVLRKPAVRTLFNASQTTVTVWIASLAYAWAGGPREGLEAAPTLGGSEMAVRMGAPVLLLCFLYWVVNRSLVVRAVSWATDRSYFRVWREDWLSAQRLITDSAAFLLSPLMVISYHAIGYPGVVLFYAPLFMIHESDRRYTDLKRAEEENTRQAVWVAKGEIAARTGHEMNNRLVAIKSRAQMLLADAANAKYDNVTKYAQIIADQAKLMEVMARGLMDYTRIEVHVEPMDLNALISNTIEFVKANKSMNGVEWQVELDTSLPLLQVDVMQMQGVFLNLFNNAGDAMQGQSGRRAIEVTTRRDERARSAVIDVIDTGPGIRAEHLPRMFEFMFTTKPDGHGFGLAISHRAIENHGGRIKVQNAPGRGAHFTIHLPLAGPVGAR